MGQGRNDVRPDWTPQNLSQLSLSQLVEQARQALKARDYAWAASLYREALRRAPFRQDLRDGLSAAIEGKVLDPHSRPAATPTQPPPPPPPPESPRRAPAPSPRPRPRRAAPPPTFFDQPEPEDPGLADPAYGQARDEAMPDELYPADNAYPADEEYVAESDELDSYMEEPAPPPHRPTRPAPPYPADRRPTAPPRDGVRRPDGRGAPARPALRPAPPPPRRVPAYREPEPEYYNEPAYRGPESHEPAGQSVFGRPARATGPSSYRPAPPPVRRLGQTSRYQPGTYNRRHRRGPLSAILLCLFAGLVMVGAGAAVWYYLPQIKARMDPEAGERARLEAVMDQVGVYIGRGEESKAIDLLQKQPASKSRDAELGRIFGNMGDKLFSQQPPNYQGAIEAYKSAVAFCPDQPAYGLHLGETYYLLGDTRKDDRQQSAQCLEQARQAFADVLKRYPANIDALKWQGKVALARHDDVLFWKTQQQIINAAPDSPEAVTARRALLQRGMKLREN